MSIDDYADTTYYQFDLQVKELIKNEHLQWRHTRALISSFTGVDQRKIIELPGDFVDAPITNADNAAKLKEKWGKFLKKK